jgi:hypothetical protein
MGVNRDAPHDTMRFGNEEQGTYERQVIFNIGFSYRRIKNAKYEISYQDKTKKYKKQKIREFYLDLLYDIRHDFTPVMTFPDAKTRDIIVPDPFHKLGWKLGMDLQSPARGLTWGLECAFKPQYTNSWVGFISVKVGYQLGMKIPFLTQHRPEQK